MSRYDRALTVFSPDGRLFQVEYAMRAVKQGASTIAVKGANCVVLGAETRTLAKLQKKSTMKKIMEVDEHIAVVFAGLTADARVLLNKARVECQSYRLTMDDSPSVQYVSKYIAGVQQSYTTRGGRRPFGLSTLIAGWDIDGSVRLFHTIPSGTFSEWQANAVGRKSDMVMEFLEEHYKAELPEDETIKLAVKALMETVEKGEKSIDIAVLTANKKLRRLSKDEIKAVADLIKKEAEDEEKESGKKKGSAMET